ncbi:MAG: hydrogenase iron-sulfur subunit [bacterium]|nr:hydrogenase iron-sulfur subunit [bacterium]
MSRLQTQPSSDLPDTAGWEPHLVAFVCKWCSSAGADMAGTTRRSYPANVRLVRFPCTGRMNPLFILKAFDQGADGVLVSGCHPGDCHYVQGNLVARRRFALFRSLVDFIGLDLNRLHFAWVSAAEGVKWTEVVKEVTASVRQVGPLPLWTAPADTPELPAVESGSTPSTSGLLPNNELQAVTGHLKNLFASLLRDNSITTAYGYSEGSLPGRMVPARFTTPDEVEALTWGTGCLTNLTAYLSREGDDDTTALIVKQCDAGAVTGLIREGQIDRDKLVLIGAPCDGGPSEKCRGCSGASSPICDWIVTADGAVQNTPAALEPHVNGCEELDAEIAAIEALSAEHRWQYWQDQFARCLRCYACRASCPMCYCETCIANKHQPQWIPTTINERGNAAWNIVRALHLIGRCTSCGECSRVCPANLRLDLLSRKLNQEVERLFGSELPLDAETPTVLNLFRMDDPDDYIR